MLTATLRALHDQAPIMTRSDAQIGAAPAGDVARAEVMRSFLKGHLHDRDIGVDALCRTFNVSGATVYRLFAEEGGFAAYVRRADPAATAASVANKYPVTLAFDWLAHVSSRSC